MVHVKAIARIFIILVLIITSFIIKEVNACSIVGFLCLLFGINLMIEPVVEFYKRGENDGRSK